MRTFADKSKSTQQATPTRSAIPSRLHYGQPLAARSILALQRTLGEQATQRLLQTHGEETDARTTAMVSGFGHNFSQTPVHAADAGTIQAKLAVNAPGDSYEEEADRVSEQMMRMPEPRLQFARGVLRSPGQPLNMGRMAALPVVHEALRSPGQPLDAGTRAFFERRLHHNLEHIRVHTGARAAESAESVRAQAYTVGSHVVFGEGKYAPGTSSGRRLLGHELAHTLQQRSTRSSDGAGALAPTGGVALQRQPTAETDKPKTDKPKTAMPKGMPDRLKMMQGFPEYLDNNIKEVNYFTAELAIIHYRDGSKFKLGLTSEYIKPPVVEVDYFTPAEEIRLFQDASGRVGFMLEAEMEQAPRTMTYAELLKTYVHDVNFYIEAGTGRIVPSRINMLTAPTLCAVLRDSYRRYGEQVQMAVQIGLGGTIAMSGYAGAGGFPKGTGVTATKMFGGAAARVTLTPTGRKLAREMNELLANGATKTLEAKGVQFMDVQVARQGNVLAVKRFMSHSANPGKGIGSQMAKEFEDAAAEVGRISGAKTVTVDVGIIINPGWRQILESRGYVRIVTEGRWVKTIKL
jgi:GNAT superfamily N-acetyltransferase